MSSNFETIENKEPVPKREKDEEMEINETPALEDKYKKHRGYLIEQIDKITPNDIAKTKEKINEKKENETDEEKLSKFENLEMAINAILSLRELNDKQKVIEDLAKRKLFELDDAEKLASFCEGSLGDAIYNLNQATYALARSKFPEDVEKQERAMDEFNQKKIEKLRDELMKKNVE